MSPSELKEYLKVITEANLMSVHLVIDGLTLSGTFGPPMPVVDENPMAGGWKMDPQDALDPDPLQLGALDAPFAHDPVAPTEPEVIE